LLPCCPAAAEKKAAGTKDPGNLPTHTLVFGGDVFLGRGFSRALYDSKSWPDIFGDLGSVMKLDAL
jgi:hypothetical protein